MNTMKNLVLVVAAAVLVVGCGDERDTSSRNTSASTNLSKKRFAEIKNHKTISRLVQKVECNTKDETAKLSYYETDVETTIKSDDGRDQRIPEVVKVFVNSDNGRFVSYSESRVLAVMSTSTTVTNKYDVVDDELRINRYGKIMIDGGELAVEKLNSTKGVLVLKKDVTVEKVKNIGFYNAICK